MSKVLVIGSLNMDMVVSVNRIPKLGETTLSLSMDKHNGGKGANQAVAASKFGVETYMVGSVGNDDNGRLLVENLMDSQINVEGVKVHDSENTGVAWITVDKNGDNTIVVISGSNGKVSKEDIDANDKLFDEADIILLQLEIPLETVKYAINKGVAKHCKIILNPAPAMELDQDILSKVDIITPNESELDILTKGITGNRLSKARQLINLGVKNVVCTLGEKGALLVNDNGYYEFSSYTVDAIDTTGAGDCFNGVLAAQIANGESIEDSIKMAIKAAAISVTKRGAQSSMPSRQDVEKKYKENLYIGGIDK